MSDQNQTLQFFTFERDGAVAIITLNRPDAANGMHTPLCRELLQLAVTCDTDPDIRAVIITGAGKMFSAGGDLNYFASLGDNVSAGLSEMTAILHAALSRLMRMDKPLITAVNGTAAGAGMSLAVTGDMVLAAASAKFTMAYTAAGLVPDGSSTFTLPRLIGLRRTQELMLTNRRLSAEEAESWGMVTRVTADEELLAEAKALAQTLANGPTRAFGAVRRLLLETYSNGFETQMELEGRAITRQSASQDGREGIAAFTNKRRPSFTGN